MAKYHITNTLAVDRFCAVKLANLNYKQDSRRSDDLGSLWVAPVISAGWAAPLGLLAIFATTNGDPIFLGLIEDGEVTWCEEGADSPGIDSVLDVLERAEWIHSDSGEGYSFLLQESLPILE